MSMSLASSPTLYFKTPTKPTLSPNFPFSTRNVLINTLPFHLKTTFANPQQTEFHGFPFSNAFGSPFAITRRNSELVKIKGHNANATTGKNEGEEDAARGESTMPERFRYLTKEAPDKPVWWPWFVALGFMLYAWRNVLWELSNWRKAVGAIFRFFGYISKLILAFIFHFIGDPVTSSIHGIETTIYTIRAFYSSIIAYAPIRELVTIIVLASAVLAIAEATVPDSVNNQPYLLTVSGLIGFAAVRNYISELFFWTLLVGLFGFARLIKKRDYLSSALPVAATLAAVGEPWVRAVVMLSYLTLAIFHHSNKTSNEKEEQQSGPVNRVPVPLVCVALAIGVRIGAKWAGYRHLTWMVV